MPPTSHRRLTRALRATITVSILAAVLVVLRPSDTAHPSERVVAAAAPVVWHPGPTVDERREIAAGVERARLARFYEWAAAQPKPVPAKLRVYATAVSEPVVVDVESHDDGPVEQMILDVFGTSAAVNVARCESHFDPAAVNGQYRGLFQLGNYHRARAERLGYSWDQMFEAYPNIVVAHDLWSEQGWRPWECKP